ncbi:hypothetical protein Q3G72_004328 [Acer saccharum]|nr:hypothetical protein Q3G72_004328 [Acer saccharum]
MRFKTHYFFKIEKSNLVTGLGSSEVAKYKGGWTFNSHKKMSFCLAQADADLEAHEGNNCFGIKSATDLHESHAVSRMLKRAYPYGFC